MASKPKSGHATVMRKILEWLPISFRIKSKTLVLPYKVLHALPPPHSRPHLLHFPSPTPLEPHGPPSRAFKKPHTLCPRDFALLFSLLEMHFLL